FVGGAGALFDLDSFTFGPFTEAEGATSFGGTQAAAHAPASAGKTLGYIENGDWAGYPNNTANTTSFVARVASNGLGGSIEVRSGSTTGTLLGTAAVPVTGGWETFATVSTALTGNVNGQLFLVFK